MVSSELLEDLQMVAAILIILGLTATIVTLKVDLTMGMELIHCEHR